MNSRLPVLSVLAVLLVITAVSGQVITTTYTETATLSNSCSQIVQEPQISTSTTIQAICSATVPITYTKTSTQTTTSSTSIMTTSSSSSTQHPFIIGSNVYYGGESAKATPNTGVYSLINAEPESFGNGYGGCIAFWTADNSFSSGLWGQVGYYECDGNNLAIAFYQIWNLDSYSIVTSGTLPAPLSYGEHNFTMTQTLGTVWSFLVDGLTIGSVDMGSNTPGSTEPIFALGEQNGVAEPASFPQIKFESAINVQINGIWTHPATSIYSPGNPWPVTITGANSYSIALA